MRACAALFMIAATRYSRGRTNEPSDSLTPSRPDEPRARKGSLMSDPSAGQQFIRQVNDCIYGVLAKLDVEDGEFWCECRNMSCEARVKLTLREYAALRARDDEPLLSRVHDPVTA
jgi:hypothetical protein